MNKRQRKKQQKKQMLLAIEEVFDTCLEADDPLATFEEIKMKGEQYFKDWDVEISSEEFAEIMSQLELIIKEEIELTR